MPATNIYICKKFNFVHSVTLFVVRVDVWIILQALLRGNSLSWKATDFTAISLIRLQNQNNDLILH